MIRLANPSHIITIGKVSKTHLPNSDIPTTHIIHPAAIMRMNSQQKEYHIKRSIHTINTLAGGLT